MANRCICGEEAVEEVMSNLDIRRTFHLVTSEPSEISTAISNSAPGAIHYFLPATLEVEADLTIACLSYIVQRIPAQPLHKSILESTSLCAHGPFVSYAAVYWPFNMQSMVVSTRTASTNWYKDRHQTIDTVMIVLGNFLSSRLLLMSG